MKALDRSFWDQHWQDNHTPWDLGEPTRALRDWADTVDLTGKEILIPGCGAGHDADFLAEKGAKVTAVDISDSALALAAQRYPAPAINWRHCDVLELPFDNRFDFVWEYTCYCALPPESRDAYLASLAKALKRDGIYFGLVFRAVRDPDDGPPFQVDPTTFRQWLERSLTVKEFEDPATHSIKPRSGNEIWFKAIKA